MAIVVGHSPSMGTLGMAAYAGGIGRRRRRDSELAAQQAFAQQQSRRQDERDQRNREFVLERDERQHMFDMERRQDFRSQYEEQRWAAEMERAMMADQQAIQEGLRSGSLYYTPEQKQELARINDAIARLPILDQLTGEEKSQLLSELQARKQMIRPLERSADEQPPSRDELGRQHFGEQWDAALNQLPWDFSEGSPKMPRGLTIRSEDLSNEARAAMGLRPLGDGGKSVQEVDQEAWGEELKAFTELNKQRAEYRSSLASQLTAEGDPEFTDEEIEMELRRIFGDIQAPLRPDQRQSQREQFVRKAFQLAAQAHFQGKWVDPEDIRAAGQFARQFGMDPEAIMVEEANAVKMKLESRQSNPSVWNSDVEGGAAPTQQPAPAAAEPGPSQAEPSPSQRTWQQFFGERLESFAKAGGMGMPNPPAPKKQPGQGEPQQREPISMTFETMPLSGEINPIHEPTMYALQQAGYKGIETFPDSVTGQRLPVVRSKAKMEELEKIVPDGEFFWILDARNGQMGKIPGKGNVPRRRMRGNESSGQKAELRPEEEWRRHGTAPVRFGIGGGSTPRGA